METAQAVNDQHDYRKAVEWLEPLLFPPAHRPPTGYEWEALQRMRQLPSKHLEHTRELEQQGDFRGALDGYAQIASLYPWKQQAFGQPLFPERKKFLEAVREETARCRLAYATALFNQGGYEEALGQLRPLVTEPDVPPSSVDKACKLVPEVVRQAARQRMKPGQYPEALALFDRARQDFKRPEVLARLGPIQRAVEREIFGFPLGENHLTLPGPERRGDPPRDIPDKAAIKVKNEGKWTILLVYRGLQSAALTLAPGEAKTVVLEPGPYVVGIFAPSNPQAHTAYEEFTLEPGTYCEVFKSSQDPRY